jgi:DNA-directed RNA polymerase sigma subunit (sigma70/sigma32)
MTAGRRLVVSNARRYLPSHGDLASALHLGEQGLGTAIDRFDEAKGFAFQTYATWWIQQAINRGGLGGLGGVREPRSPNPKFPSETVHLDVDGTAV